MDKGLKNFVDNYYTPFIGRYIHYRYTVIIGFICVLIVSGGMCGWFSEICCES